MMGSGRIDRKFSQLRAECRAGLVTFLMAGDPSLEVSRAMLAALPTAGADIIEIGMPFSDPMADGPAIQRAGQRALASGQNLAKTLDLVRDLRAADQDTPIVLMGYYNPIYRFGNQLFLDQARDAGVDGLIIVDLPPEADTELCLPAKAAGLNFIRLATPTTDGVRLPRVLTNASGFLYYVSLTGITGAATLDPQRVATALTPIKAATNLPIAVGFGVKTAQQVSAVAAAGADAVVVGTALVEQIEANMHMNGDAVQRAVTGLVGDLSSGLRG